MKKILILALFIFLFNFNSVSAINNFDVILKGLDTSNSGGQYNSADPNFSTGPIDINYGGRVAFRWDVGKNISPATCTTNIGISPATFQYYEQNPTLVGGTLSVNNIKVTTTYFLTCNGITASVLVRVKIPPPTVILTANPNSIPYNGSTTLTWSTTNADSCSGTSNPINNSWNNSQKSVNDSSYFNSLQNTTTFTLNCTGPSGSATASATVTVAPEPPPSPTITFSANPVSVPYDGSTTLTWSSTNSTSCIASSSPNTSWNGNKSTNGSQLVNNLIITTNFTIRCIGGGGELSKNVIVNVALPPTPPPTITLLANPTIVAIGGETNLTWTSTNTTTCTASSSPNSSWNGTKNKNGTQSVKNINVNTTFTLICTGPGGTSSQEALVSIALPPNPLPRSYPKQRSLQCTNKHNLDNSKCYRLCC